MVMGVFVLSSALNYLDRQILAALAPLLRDLRAAGGVVWYYREQPDAELDEDPGHVPRR